MVMGKKKVQKTKELSVAIAEASSAGEKTQQTQPRKRGRPRKIVEKTEIREEKQEEIILEEAAAGGEAKISITGSSFKKGKSSEAEQPQQHDVEQQEGSSLAIACTRFTKDPKGEPSRSSSRRKSKPRKSS